MKRLVAIIGPTGIGKSRLAIHLASLYHGEIIGADSRQVYRYMDIGTAKPTPQEMAQVPHHLIDIVNPDEDFSLARYQALAMQAIEGIHERQKVPFLVGGTGLYIWAVLEGWQIPGVSPDRDFRYNLEKRASEDGADELYRELVRVAPEAAEKIDRRNVRRVIRALEVYQQGSSARLGRKKAPAFDIYIIGLTDERAELYRIVDQRVEDMVAGGFIGEVENLLKMGYDLKLPAMSGIGYRQIGKFLNGEMTLAAAKQQIKTQTHRFIRHQYAWFRLKDERIRWFEAPQRAERDIEEAIGNFLNN